MVRMMRCLFTGAGILAALFWLQGCTGPTIIHRGDPSFKPVHPMVPPPAMQREGTIYSAETARSLFEDIKARRVGDLLTVILAEQTDASKKASTGVTKDTSVDVSAPKLLGRDVNIGGNPIDSKIDSAQEFSGESDSSQSNKLQGSITVTVAEVLPNGNLVVQGEKWIGINQGQEYVRLRGIVRPVDIDPSNTVVSTQVADAQIYYQGKGAQADANAVGWMGRFFLSPLWPF